MAFNWKWSYLLNPLGAVADYINDKTTPSTAPGGSDYQPPHGDSSLNRLSTWLTQRWNDLTGVSQIELQNKYNREMAEEEYQRNLQAIGDTAAAYEAAGFNRNLMYGNSAASYSAPQLQAYSGSAKLDNILSRIGKVVGMIPAFYQASAALEGIDQAREKTKQDEIKTMSMGMSLLDQGYKLGDTQLSHPFNVDMFLDPAFYGGKRHYKNSSPLVQPNVLKHGDRIYFDDTTFSRYADAALRNKFDLLNSIGIKNKMNSTLADWRGYQYDLDRRFGEIGRIVGLAGQGAGVVSKLLPVPRLR